MANKIKVKSGDKVLVIAGKDKGKIGKILEVKPSDNAVVVEGVNIVSKHKKAKNAQDKAAIVKKENKVNVSNVQIVCPDCKKATRIAYAFDADKKFRKCKKCGASLDKAVTVKKAAKATTAKSTAKTTVKPVATKIDRPASTKKVVKTTVKQTTGVTTKKTAVRKTADKG